MYPMKGRSRREELKIEQGAVQAEIVQAKVVVAETNAPHPPKPVPVLHGLMKGSVKEGVPVDSTTPADVVRRVTMS